MPKPPKMPDPIPAPAAPQPTKARDLIAPRMLTPAGAAPDIRIGSQKGATKNRNRTSSQGLRGSLNINSGKGLNV